MVLTAHDEGQQKHSTIMSPLILLLKRTLTKIRRNIPNEETQENEMPPSLIPWEVLESIVAEQCS